MSQYTRREGQAIGPWTVEADAGRTKRGEVLWRLRNGHTGKVKHLRTYAVIKLARTYGVPASDSE